MLKCQKPDSRAMVAENPLTTRVDRALQVTVDFLKSGTLPTTVLESLTDLMALSIATDVLKNMFCDIDMQDTTSAEYVRTANMIQLFNEVQDSEGIWLLIAVLLDNYVDEHNTTRDAVIRLCKNTVDKEFKEWATEEDKASE